MKLYSYVLIPRYGRTSDVLYANYSWLNAIKQKRRFDQQTRIRRIRL